MSEVLAGVADNPQRVGGRIEVDAEKVPVKGHRQPRHQSSRRRAGIDGVDAALIPESVELSVLNPEIYTYDHGVRRLQSGDVPISRGRVGVHSRKLSSR